MSSRNKYLSPEERQEAVCLFRGLEACKALYEAGERDVDALKVAVRNEIEKTSGVVDYIELLNDETLQEFSEGSDGQRTVNTPALVALAVRFSGARLIDNAMLGK
jgi:pantoate--beta-alanine ligase